MSSTLMRDDFIATDADALRADVYRHYGLTFGQDLTHDPEALLPVYLYKAIALALRDRLVARAKLTAKQPASRRVYYLSLEFLIGRTLSNAVHALALEAPLRDLLLEFGINLEGIAEAEHDAGLGNGGLGRLAACFLDSCATLNLPVMGYGIRYEYGMFQQRLEHGEQVEYPDHWLRDGNPWEFERSEDTRRIRFYGHTEHYVGSDGRRLVRWLETEDVLAIPYDVLIPGHNTEAVNRLRLWKAEATDEFNLDEFHAGSYTESVAAKNLAENITMVLYPNDVSENGKALRLRQQYFLASASLQDVVHLWVEIHGRHFGGFGAANVFQLNDTHPSCAVPELMRILLDDNHMNWDDAWKVTSQCMAYTNHTLLPEALERWSVGIFQHLLPRILEIIYEINARFLLEVAHRWPGDVARLRAMSIIEEGDERYVRMSYLAIVGSFSVNGVAALHSHLLARDLFSDFYALWPHKFNNKTNGVTPRRWIYHANPRMTALISSAIGDAWQRDLAGLAELQAFAEDSGFRQQWQQVKLANKQVLVQRVKRLTDIALDPTWLLDVQVKRIHEYKRQLLNIFHVIHRYDQIHRGEGLDQLPRSVLIGGKAAPGYAQARLIIHLITSVAAVVNSDPVASELLRVVFLPNYDVSAMEYICPAAELSEQISTAGKEASGTGNMKLMMNGALTIGTLDGANIEILEHVGADNFYQFGLTADQVSAARNHYDPMAVINNDVDLQRVLALIDSDHFSLFAPGRFRHITDAVRAPADPWMIAADFRSYIDTQARVALDYRDQASWQARSIRNTAASGWFSSDRTIRDYARDIWKIQVAAKK